MDAALSRLSRPPTLHLETLFCTFHSIPPPVTSFRKQKAPRPALKRPRTSRPLKGPRRLSTLLRRTGIQGG